MKYEDRVRAALRKLRAELRRSKALSLEHPTHAGYRGEVLGLKVAIRVVRKLQREAVR